MGRFGLLAALGLRRAASSRRPLLEMLRERRAAREGDDGRAFEGAQAFEPSLPSGVQVERDIAFGSDPAQRLDVYRSAAARGAPVVVYVHGGGWRRGDKAMAQMVRNKVPHWTGLGHVVVSTNYRMLPDAGVLEQADDVALALAFVQAQAAAWGGDPARVVLVGHSAGAHLAALLSADAGIAMRQGARPWLGSVLLDTAALDMVAVMGRPHYPQYRFYDPVFGADPAFWREASPLHRLQSRPAAPMLLVCSAQREDSCVAAREFADKAALFGGRADVLPVDFGHLEINDQLGLRNDYTTAVDAFMNSIGAGSAASSHGP